MSTDKIFQTPEIKLSSEYCPDFQFSKQTSKQTEDKNTGKLTEPITYFTAPIVVNHHNSNGILIRNNRFLVEGPEMSTKRGIMVKTNNGRVNASLLVSFNMSNPYIKAFIGEPIDSTEWDAFSEPEKESVGVIQRLYRRAFDSAFKTRGQIDIRNIKLKSQFEAIFKDPLRWNVGQDGNIIQGSNPQKYFELRLFMNEGETDPLKARNKTIFSTVIPDSKDPSKIVEKVLDWKYLTEHSFNFKPLIHFTKLSCVAGKVTLKCIIVSAVVTSIPIKNQITSDQIDTINDLKQNHALALQMKTMMQDFEDSNKISEKKEKEEEEVEEKKEEKSNGLKNNSQKEEEDNELV